MARYAEKRRKFREGPIVRTLAEAVMHMSAGDWLYLHQKPQHPRVIACMTIGTLEAFIRGGSCKLAIRNEGAMK
jgi:hypothetical protein